MEMSEGFGYIEIFPRVSQREANVRPTGMCMHNKHLHRRHRLLQIYSAVMSKSTHLQTLADTGAFKGFLFAT